MPIVQAQTCERFIDTPHRHPRCQFITKSYSLEEDWPSVKLTFDVGTRKLEKEKTI